MTATVTYMLDAIGDGTKFTRIIDYTMPGWIFGKFVDKLVAQRIGG